jgi:O-antigen/teichoic acid export membrane protein
MQSARRVALNTGFLYARMAVTVFISLYTTRLILNALGSDDFGIFNVVGGAVAMLTFLNAAMASATQRFMSYAKGEANERKETIIFNVSIVLHLFIGILIVILLEIAGVFLFNGILKIDPSRIDAAKMIFHFMVVGTFFTIISVPYDAVINARENMLLVAILGVIESIFKLAIAIFITQVLSDKLIFYGLLTALSSIVLLIIRRIYCHKNYREVQFNPRLYYDKTILKDMKRFFGWNFLGVSTSMIGNYGIGIVLNMFWGTALNAALGIAVQLNGQLLVFSNTMMQALNPSIVKAEGGGDRNKMLKISMIGCKFSFFLFAFFAIPFIIETPYILKIWLKHIPEWAIIFCRLAIIRTLLEQLTLPLNTSINAEGNIKKFNVVKTILNLIPLPIVYWLFTAGCPPYMIYVVSIFIWAIIGGIITIFYTAKNCNLDIREYFNQVFTRSTASFVISFAIGLSLSLFYSNSFISLIAIVFTSTISFMISVYYIGLSIEEKQIILSIFKYIYSRIRKNHSIN